MFVILSYNKSSERNLSHFFWQNKTQKERESTESIIILSDPIFNYMILNFSQECNSLLESGLKKSEHYTYILFCVSFHKFSCDKVNYLVVNVVRNSTYKE